MNIIGGFTFKSDIVDGFDASELYSPSYVEHATIEGAEFIYVSGTGDDGLQVLQLDANGQISAIQNVPYSSSNMLDSPRDLEIVDFGGETYLVSASIDDDALSVFRIDNDNNGTNGHLQLTDTISASDITGFSAALDGVHRVEGFELNNSAIIMAGAAYGDAVSTFRIDSNGEISLLDPVFNSDATSLELNGVEDVEKLVIAGTQFAFVASSVDEGISVFDVNLNNGALTNVFNYQGDRDYYSLTPLDYNGENLLVAAGDGYIDIFTIGSDGSLAFQAATQDDAANSYYPGFLETIEIDGVPFILASDGSSNNQVGVYGIDEDYGFVQVQNITGSPAFDNADETKVVQIGSKVFVVSAVEDTSRVTVTELGAGDEVLVGTEGADRIVGLNGSDDLLGRAGRDEIKGGSGDDVLSGNLGNDTLYGDGGEDVVVGGNGNDLIIGGADADILKGGGGSDWLSYETSSAKVKVDLSTGSATGGDAAGDLFRGFENLRGSSKADELTGDSAANEIEGLSGADQIKGGNGADTIKGGNGNDVVDGQNGADVILGQNGNDALSGGNGDDEIAGGNGKDTLFGGNGRDDLQGGGQADVLTGGGGDDTLSGNAGRDTFVFSGAFGNDEVTDFSTGAGGDILDFSEIAEIESVADFKAQAFSIAGNTIVTFDDANLSITLFGVHENDFGESNFDF